MHKVFSDYLDTDKDTSKATINILEDWLNQKLKCDAGMTKIKDINARLAGKTSKLGTEPVSGGGGNKTEDQWCDGIDRKMKAEAEYFKAYDFLHNLLPLWGKLSNNERSLLIARYVKHEECIGIQLIMQEMRVTKKEAYKRSDAALEHLAKIIFW